MEPLPVLLLLATRLSAPALPAQPADDRGTRGAGTGTLP